MLSMLTIMTSTTTQTTMSCARYLREERAPQATRPLNWWREHHHRFPVLRHLAFEILAAPASSSADERIFSMAGNVVNDERPNTIEESAEAY